MSAFVDKLLAALYPHRCLFCSVALPPSQRMCGDCLLRAPFLLPPVCPRCGRGEDVCICGKRTHAFERCVSPFYHTGVAQSRILRLKSEYDRDAAAGFAAEMAEVIRREYGGIAFDWITSVPLHKKDRRARGFDQAMGLAKALSERLEVPYAETLCKLVQTQPQKELPAVRRRGNLLGVFDVTAEVAGRTILLVDDVITTGSTLDECAKMLRIFGAAEVYGVTAAAAGLKNDDK